LDSYHCTNSGFSYVLSYTHLTVNSDIIKKDAKRYICYSKAQFSKPGPNAKHVEVEPGKRAMPELPLNKYIWVCSAWERWSLSQTNKKGD
jgi:hypothetical protein